MRQGVQELLNRSYPFKFFKGCLPQILAYFVPYIPNTVLLKISQQGEISKQKQ